MRIAAIVPAAGLGKRMGSDQEKQFLELAGKPIIVHTLMALSLNPNISEIYLVTLKEKVEYGRRELVEKYQLAKVSQIVAGGAQRQDSVANGLLALQTIPDLILVHDGVRPLVSQDTINRVIAAAQEFGAAIAALPVKETIKAVDADGLVRHTLERSQLWTVQTPQVFRYQLFKEALKQAQQQNFYATDEAGLVERIGHPVKVVPGNPENIKITTPEDLAIAEYWLGKTAPCIR